MDIYNLINSKAISEYCRKINHKFNIEEVAVLIHRNDKMSVKEKINAYDEIIKNYEDMEIIERANCKYCDSAKYMIKKEILRLKNLQEYDQEENDIDNIFINIPNPFKRGDLLQYNNKILVLDWIITDKEKLNEELLKGKYDSMDMYGYCYLVDEKGNVYCDDIHNYDSWEYADKELTGMERILKLISNSLKGKIGLDLLLTAYDYIKTDSNVDNLKFFTDEGLALAGFNEEDIRKIKQKEE